MAVIFFLWSHGAARGILVPRSGIECALPLQEALTTGSPGKSQVAFMSIDPDLGDLSDVRRLQPSVHLPSIRFTTGHFSNIIWTSGEPR